MEQSFIGYLVISLSALVGLFTAVFVPLMKIVSRLTSIETKIDNMNDILDGHKSKIEEHDKKLGEHDIKIAKLEQKGRR